MKGWKWALAGLAGAALLAGCKGFWDALPSTGGGGGGGNASGVFYVLDQAGAAIDAYSFASGSTTATVVTGSPFSLGASPLAMAITPGGGFLYVSSTAGIYAYSIGSGGALTLLNNNSAFDPKDLATTLVVDPTGAWLIGATSGVAVAYAIPLDTTTGLLDSTREEKTADLSGGTAIQQLAISPSGSTNSYLFVAMGTAGTDVLSFTAANASPFGSTATTYKVKNTDGADNAIAVDPSNRLLYVGETAAVTGTQTGGLRAYSIGANSALTEISGSPFATGGTGPSSILATTSYVYVANRAVSGSSTGNITGFPVTSSGTTYGLGTLINTIAAGTNTLGLAEDSSNTYLLAVNSNGSPGVSAYNFDATTAGKLDSYTTITISDTSVSATPVAIIAVP